MIQYRITKRSGLFAYLHQVLKLPPGSELLSDALPQEVIDEAAKPEIRNNRDIADGLASGRYVYFRIGGRWHLDYATDVERIETETDVEVL